jgi:predicted ATPase/DNA-binding SARP family transcriptional activator
MADNRNVQQPSAIWHIQLFGRLRASYGRPRPDFVSISPLENDEGSTLVIEQFQTQKTALLFAILALNPDKPQYREDLIARLWPDAEAPVGRDRLSQALSWLRRHLETKVKLPPRSVLQADRYAIQLVPDSVVTDVMTFDAAIRSGRKARKPEEQEHLKRAVQLYEGPLLPGLADQERWLFVERERLVALFEAALRRSVRLAETAGQLDRAIEYCRRLLWEVPEDEKACGDLMRLLATTGDTAGALREYTAFIEGDDPSEQQEPSEWLLQLAADIRNKRFTVLPSSSLLPHAKSTRRFTLLLPLTLARFFGREEELRVLLERLEHRERLLTLLGPGGSGKTRLSIELARHFAEPGDRDVTEGERAVFFVPLEGATVARQIMPMIYRTVQQSLVLRKEENEEISGPKLQEDTPALRDALYRLLEGIPHPLIVLDNYEQLVDDTEARLVIVALLQRISGLSVVVTSRRRLGIEGELCLAVPALPTPWSVYLLSISVSGDDPLLDFASVRMFLDRAQRARIDFALTPENRATIMEICTRLEGIPLAIELCAAWAALLTPEQMLSDLKDRFQLLVSRRQDIPERHRTMHAAIESSYRQMPPTEQQFFTRLSVFRNGWFSDATVALIEREVSSSAGRTSRDLLASLQERSLILTDTAEAGIPTMRYRMLETLREFAWDQCTEGQKKAIARWHANYYREKSEITARQMTGSEQRQWLDLMEADQDNLRAALAFFKRNVSEATPVSEVQTESAIAGLRLCIALTRFWQIRGYLQEGREQLEFFLPHLTLAGTVANPESIRLQAQGQSSLGQLAWAQGDFSVAHIAQKAALDLWRKIDDRLGLAAILLESGMTAYRQSRLDEAHGLLSESLAISRKEGGNLLLMAGALLNLGNIARDRQELEQARALFVESLSLARRVGDERRTAAALNNLGNVARLQGHYREAFSFHEETIALRRSLGDRTGIAMSLLNLAETARRLGDLDRATALITESLLLMRELSDRYTLTECLFVMASIASSQHRQERAALLLAASEAQRRAMTVSLVAEDQTRHDDYMKTARESLGEAKFQKAIIMATAMSLPEIIDYALKADSGKK